MVDDDDSIRELLCEVLASMGFQVLGCRDGSEGLRAVQQLHPSALTLDLHMPGMDGVEVLDRLAGDEQTASVPVVVVSAYSTDCRLQSRSQVKAIVQKPFDVDELCEKVRGVANGTARAA